MVVKTTGEITIELIRSLAQMAELSHKVQKFDLSNLENLSETQLIEVSKIAQEEIELRSKINTLKWVVGMENFSAVGDIAPGSTAV